MSPDELARTTLLRKVVVESPPLLTWIAPLVPKVLPSMVVTALPDMVRSMAGVAPPPRPSIVHPWIVNRPTQVSSERML